LKKETWHRMETLSYIELKPEAKGKPVEVIGGLKDSLLIKLNYKDIQPNEIVQPVRK
jgi:hypothetical protein